MGLANSQEGVKLEEQDCSHQYHSCTSLSVQLWNSQLVKTRNWEGRLKNHLTVEGIHHPQAYLNGLDIKRPNGGCGIVKLESAYNAAIFGLNEYIKEGKDRLTRLVQEYDAGKAKYSL